MRAYLFPTALACLLAIAPSYFAPSSPPATECVGDGCSAVALTFDEAKRQYRVQNNASDAWVRLTASNQAAAAEVCVAPGKADYLPLKSIVGAYKAVYGSSCGGGGGT